MSNSGTQTAIRFRPIDETYCGESSACGVSNAIDQSEHDGLGLKDPWTKVTNGKEAFQRILARHSIRHAGNSHSRSKNDEDEVEEKRLVEDLFEMLG